MKKREPLRAAAETALGSPSVRGVDVSVLYIDMLCEKFKDRGIRMGMTSGNGRESRENTLSRELGARLKGKAVSATDAKYRSLNIDGKAYMSSDDFAAYYKDLRNYKLPTFYSRAENEYEEAEKAALAERNVQESGRSPKKAEWLAIAKHVKNKMREIPSHINKEELGELADEWFLSERTDEVVEGKRSRLPAGVISTFLVITLSLLMIVCSSVMVSRASREVSSMEDEIDSLSYQIRDLEGKLEVKNDMLDIQRIAVEEYGMISGDYASSRYIDLKEDEKLEIQEGSGRGESWLSQLLRAIAGKS